MPVRAASVAAVTASLVLAIEMKSGGGPDTFPVDAFTGSRPDVSVVRSAVAGLRIEGAEPILNKQKQLRWLSLSILVLGVLSSGCSTSDRTTDSSAAAFSADPPNAQSTGDSTLTTSTTAAAATIPCPIGAVASVADIARPSFPEVAEELYKAVLDADTSSLKEKACAAEGLVAIARSAKSADEQPPSSSAKSWEKTYADVVTPVWTLIVPISAIFVVLLLSARLLPRWVVNPDDHGPERPYGYQQIQAWLLHWVLGIGGLAVAAIAAVLGLAAIQRPASGRTDSAALLVVAVFAVVAVAFACVSTIPRRGPDRVLEPVGNVRWIVLVGVVVIFCLVLWDWCWGSQRLRSVEGVVVLAAICAVAGATITARTNGLQAGILLQGHKADGTDNPAVGQLVQAQLYVMGSGQAKGLLIPQGTDVSDLSDNAVKLLPEGAFQQLVGMVVRVLWPVTAWRMAVDELDPVSVQATLWRNGRWAATETIRVSDVWPEPLQPASSDGPSNPAHDASPAPDRSSALWIGAAAFALCELAKRYSYIDQDIYRVRDWRSIAAHVAAATTSDADDRLILLKHARSLDHRNITARFALLNAQTGKDGSEKQYLVDYRNRLEELIDSRFAKASRATESGAAVRNKTGADIARYPEAMQLRLRFAITVAHCNLALFFQPAADGSESEIDPDSARQYWDAAAMCLQDLIQDLFDKNGDPTATGRTGLAYDMLGPTALIWCLVAIARAAGNQGIPTPAPFRLKHPVSGSANWADIVDLWSMELSAKLAKQRYTKLYRYERACLFAFARNYQRVEHDLEILEADAQLMAWARTDPSFRLCRTLSLGAGGRLLEILIPSEAPAEILSVPPFATYRAELESRGLTTPESLRKNLNRARKELKLGRLQFGRWEQVLNLRDAIVSHANGDPEYESEQLLYSVIKAGIDTPDKLAASIKPLEQGGNPPLWDKIDPYKLQLRYKPCPAHKLATPPSSPAMPRNLNATSGTDSISVDWLPPYDPVDRYTVTLRSKSNRRGITLTITLTTAPCEFTGVDPGEYIVSVAAVNSVGSGPKSSVTVWVKNRQTHIQDPKKVIPHRVQGSIGWLKELTRQGRKGG